MDYCGYDFVVKGLKEEMEQLEQLYIDGELTLFEETGQSEESVGESNTGELRQANEGTAKSIKKKSSKKRKPKGTYIHR